MTFANSHLGSQLFALLGTGTTLKEVDILGYSATTSALVSDSSIGTLTTELVALDIPGGFEAALAYNAVDLTTYNTVAGSTTADASGGTAIASASLDPVGAATSLDPSDIAAAGAMLAGAAGSYVQFIGQNGQPALTPTLLQTLAAGTAFQELEVLSYNSADALISDASFGGVGVNAISIGSTGTAALSASYQAVQFQHNTIGAGGVLTADPSALWNRSTKTASFTTPGPVAAPATLPGSGVSTATGDGISYYARFIGTDGTTLDIGGDHVFALSSFDFGAVQYAGFGATTPNVTFESLNLALADSSPDPMLLADLTAGQGWREVDVLGYGVSAASGGATTLLQEDSFGVATAQSLAAGSSNSANISIGYASVEMQTFTGTVCFCAGTLIATPNGARRIETLAIGDLVRTHDGGDLPVAWIGRQTVATHFADPLRDLPIRIQAGALAENVPVRDLLVSPAHAILVSDLLIRAGALVNGTSIARERHVPARFVYDHVELDAHALLLAEGVPAESFLDGIEALPFDNAAERGAREEADELPYPRLKSQRQVPQALRARLAAPSQRGHAALAGAILFLH